MIEPERADVWVIDVTDPAFLSAADSGPASDADRRRAAAMTDPDAGRMLLARRAVLRRILARYVDADPSSLRIVTAPGGKPVLVPGPAFSVAHSGAVYAIAVSGAASVGVDVERTRSVTRAAAIADRWFSVEEAERLGSVADDRRDLEFLRIWCAKEALAKRHGAGLRLMTGRGAGAGGALDVEPSLHEGTLRYFDVGEDYVAALASTEPVTEISIRRPTDELRAG